MFSLSTVATACQPRKDKLDLSSIRWQSSSVSPRSCYSNGELSERELYPDMQTDGLFPEHLDSPSSTDNNCIPVPTSICPRPPNPVDTDCFSSEICVGSCESNDNIEKMLQFVGGGTGYRDSIPGLQDRPAFQAHSVAEATIPLCSPDTHCYSPMIFPFKDLYSCDNLLQSNSSSQASLQENCKPLPNLDGFPPSTGAGTGSACNDCSVPWWLSDQPIPGLWNLDADCSRQSRPVDSQCLGRGSLNNDEYQQDQPHHQLSQQAQYQNSGAPIIFPPLGQDGLFNEELAKRDADITTDADGEDGMQLAEDVKPLESCRRKDSTTSTSGSTLSSPNPSHRSLRMDASMHETYAELIYRALACTPGHSMSLKEIYNWAAQNSDKCIDQDDGAGWKNSIRHNLSMNPAFERRKIERHGRSLAVWTLDKFTIGNGVKATASFRKSSRSSTQNVDNDGCETSSIAVIAPISHVPSPRSEHSKCDQETQTRRASFACCSNRSRHNEKSRKLSRQSRYQPEFKDCSCHTATLPGINDTSSAEKLARLDRDNPPYQPQSREHSNVAPKLSRNNNRTTTHPTESWSQFMTPHFQAPGDVGFEQSSQQDFY